MFALTHVSIASCSHCSCLAGSQVALSARAGHSARQRGQQSFELMARIQNQSIVFCGGINVFDNLFPDSSSCLAIDANSSGTQRAAFCSCLLCCVQATDLLLGRFSAEDDAECQRISRMPDLYNTISKRPVRLLLVIANLTCLLLLDLIVGVDFVDVAMRCSLCRCFGLVQDHCLHR